MSPTARFIASVFLWLPPCFGVWYFSSILTVLPLAWLLDAMMTGLFPDLIRAIEPHGNTVLAVIKPALSAIRTCPAVDADLVFEVNPQQYAYSLPLYTALVLATPCHEWAKAGYWMIGILLLFLVQAFGVAAEVTKILAFNINEATHVRLGLSRVGYEGLALTYQLGFLILPSVSPLLIWLALFRRDLPSLITPIVASGR
ncbi:exosortase H-associated membrane protein [Thiocystis violacea]|uniref:exosortase H-associated membrane protein n=1 Tax=Thiocystis violacea TaxID=13725 RepID=UPI001904E607|nr:exosortase H-associated membrane protein [Thiocystis violacea]MBK1720410.1 hypothetical protein [Thiocystis violacea]